MVVVRAGSRHRNVPISIKTIRAIRRTRSQTVKTSGLIFPDKSTTHLGIADLVKGIRPLLIKHAKLHASGKEVHQSLIQTALRNHALLHGLLQVMEQVTAVQVTSVVHRHGDGFHGRVRYVMALMEILDGPAVTGHVTRKAPLVSQNILQQSLASAARLAIGAIISTHHCLHAGFLHAGLECGQIGLRHVLLGSDRIKAVTDVLGTAVHGEMLRTGCSLQVILVMSLDALHKANAKTGGQIRILTEGLVSAAPAGITEDVYVGRPEGQSLINVSIIT